MIRLGELAFAAALALASLGAQGATLPVEFATWKQACAWERANDAAILAETGSKFLVKESRGGRPSLCRRPPSPRP